MTQNTFFSIPAVRPLLSAALIASLAAAACTAELPELQLERPAEPRAGERRDTFDAKLDSGARPATERGAGISSDDSDADADADADASPSAEALPDARRDVAAKLGAPSRFLIGLGNDVTAQEGWDPNRAHAYELGPKLDLHYMYLSGLDWPSWSGPDGVYVSDHARAAKARGVVPMFTLYQAAAWGENNLGAFDDATFMTRYWRNVRIMYTRLGAFGAPSVVHLEPDLWGYFQKRHASPSGVRVKVAALVPECADLPDDVAGFGKCLVRLGRSLAPKALIGLSASSFGASTNGKSDPQKIAAYLSTVGADASDLMIVETLDRDAGCFEAATDPLCRRAGSFYWNDSDFRAHLAWAKTIHEQTGKALLWWQMPLGTPSSKAGGAAGRYRDNRVAWLFAHPEEFAAAGGVGAVFGTGAPNQTTVKSDGNQFKNAVTQYYQQPLAF